MGDKTQTTWEKAPRWQQESAIEGVKLHLANPDAGASAGHEAWAKHKLSEGWTYGRVKDPIKKEHPCLVPFTDLPNLGFGVNWKYVEGFTFTGSPQFTGAIPSYDMVDAQVNVKFPKSHITVKVGASNLFGVVPLFDPKVPSDERLDRMFNNDVYMVYGGPRIGRVGYVQLIYEFNKQ